MFTLKNLARKGLKDDCVIRRLWCIDWCESFYWFIAFIADTMGKRGRGFGRRMVLSLEGDSQHSSNGQGINSVKLLWQLNSLASETENCGGNFARAIFKHI